MKDVFKIIFMLALAAAAILFSIVLTKWIWDSDLPTWAKVMLSK